MSTQPHAQESLPASLVRFSCSPAAKPLGGGESLRFRFGGIVSWYTLVRDALAAIRREGVGQASGSSAPRSYYVMPLPTFGSDYGCYVKAGASCKP